MKGSLCLLILLFGCSTRRPPSVAPLPPAPPPQYQRALKSAIVVPTAPTLHTNTIPWLYPAGINPNDWYWDRQETTNLITWRTVITNTTDTNSFVFTTNAPFKFYRLQGHK
jgi:hypothetical protein